MSRFARAAAVSWLSVLPLLGAQACAHHQPDPHAPTTITLVNDVRAWYEIYLLQGAQRVDVGKVNAMSTISITVPPDLSYPGSRVVMVAIGALGGYAFRQGFIANPGVTVRLRLPR
jgi:hypothetical protein